MKTKLINSFASLAVLVGLAGCGGGGGGGGEGSPQIVNENPTTSVPTVIKGFYTGTLGSHELISVVTPDMEFFALHFRSTTKPDIYSGTLNLGVNGAANATTAGLIADVSGILRPWMASLTNGSADAYTGNLTASLQEPLLFTVSKPLSSVYQVVHQALLSEISGDWRGFWSDEGAESELNIAIDSSGVMRLPFGSKVKNCGLSASITPINTVNIYKVVLTIPLQTNCPRTEGKFNDVVLNGAAVIYKFPIDGKTSRLELIAVDAKGSGISFRGDR